MNWNLLNESGNFFSPETNSFFSTEMILSRCLSKSEIKGFIACQNIFLYVILFTLRLQNIIFFYYFLKQETRKFICLLSDFSFSALGFLKNLFLKRVLCIISLDVVLVMKGLLLPHIYSFSEVHAYQKHICKFKKCVRVDFQLFIAVVRKITIHSRICCCQISCNLYNILGDSWNYMTLILVPSSTKRTQARILNTGKLNGR